jgi:two-component system, cell cycle sensor histidine kinase and response regulator CckA
MLSGLCRFIGTVDQTGNAITIIGESMNIDVRTLAIAVGIASILQVIAIFLQYRVNKAYRGIGWWVVSFASIAVGYTLLFLRDLISIKLIAIISANALILLGSILLYIGVMRFLDRKENRGIIISISAVFLLSFFYYTYVDDDITARTVIIYAAPAIIAFLTAQGLFLNKTRAIATSAYFIAVLFLFHGCFSTFRAVVALTVDPVSRLFTATMMQVLSFMILFADGILLTFGLIIMVNQRLNAEIREAKEHFELIFNTSPDAALISRLNDGIIVDINDGFSAITGFTRDETIGKSALDLDMWGNPDDRQKVVKELDEWGFCENREVGFRRKDGSPIIGILSAKVITLQELPHVISVTRDVSERRRAERMVRDSEERFRKIFEEAHLGIVIASPPLFAFEKANPAFCRMVGYSADELSSMTFADITHPDYLKQDMENVRKVGLGEIPFYQTEKRYITKDNQVLWGNLIVSSIRDNRGALRYYLSMVNDITERKRAEEEKRALEERLQRAEKMEAIGQLAGGVAHDLNNVLGVSTVYSELLQERIPEESPLRKYVDNIFSSTQKGAAIIEDLLTLARRGVMVSGVVNLNSIVSNFLKAPVFEKIQAHHSAVTFRTECQEELLNIKGSAVHLDKTLMNLVSNAAEAIFGKGEVTIRTENRYLDTPVRGYDEVKQGDYVVLTVSDTGTGISAENREKIFEPFYTKKVMARSGTGLGLAIVWGTVKDHNGYIDVQTEVGEGTTFTLYFPVTREEMISPKPKVPIEQYMGKGESVLVVDDIAQQREIATNLLTRLGYQVHAVSSGEEAVEYLKVNEVDILVLDMIMAPGIDGLETYQKVLEINPKKKAILVSGFSETDRVREAQKLGAGTYVKKPYIMEKIGVAIRDELKRA